MAYIHDEWSFIRFISVSVSKSKILKFRLIIVTKYEVFKSSKKECVNHVNESDDYIVYTPYERIKRIG